MLDYLVRGSVFEHLMQECFRLNKSLLDVAKFMTQVLICTES